MIKMFTIPWLLLVFCNAYPIDISAGRVDFLGNFRHKEVTMATPHAQFANVKPMIIKIEGDREVDDRHDYGGKSRYGISQQEYPDLDIDKLTENKAFLILETDYWEKYHLSQLENQAIANQLFFMFMNMDPVHAALIVQVSINACGRGLVHVKLDGVMGAKTIQALNTLSDQWLSNRIRLETIRYYLHEVDKDHSQEINFRGWVRRALEQ